MWNHLANLHCYKNVDDGAFYFDDKVVEANDQNGPLSTTSSVVRGLTAFADATSGNIKVTKV